MIEEEDQEPLPPETLYTERKRIEVDRDNLLRKMRYMESDSLRRAKRTVKYLTAKLEVLGRDFKEPPTW